MSAQQQQHPLIRVVRGRGGSWGIRSFRIALALCDADRDGFVTVPEVAAAMKRYGILFDPKAPMDGLLGEVYEAFFTSDDGQELSTATPSVVSSRGGGAAKSGPSVASSANSSKASKIAAAQGKAPHPDKAKVYKKKTKAAVDEVLRVAAVEPMTRDRMQVVVLAYRLIEERAGGRRPTVWSLSSLADIRAMPAVREGKVATQDALVCFFTMWGGHRNAEVGEETFIQFHEDLSPGYANEADFMAVVRGLWHLSDDDMRRISAVGGSSSTGPINIPDKGALIKLFKAIDTNNNGVLSLAELDLACVRMWPTLNNKAAIIRAYKLADADCSGYLELPEFRQFVVYLVAYNDYWRKFQEIDTSKDGGLSFQELKAAKHKLGLDGLTDIELKQLFEKMDRNGGGSVRFEEFCVAMAKIRGDRELAQFTNEW